MSRERSNPDDPTIEVIEILNVPWEFEGIEIAPTTESADAQETTELQK